MLVALLSFAGCSSPCEPPQVEAPGGGVCITPDDGESDLEGFDALPECDPGPTDGRLDVARACADGGCGTMDYDQLSEAWGDPGSCEPLGDTLVRCEWENGVHVYFSDDDGNGVPNVGEAGGCLFIEEPFDGGTEDGLALGVSMRCFVEALGDPTTYEVDAEFGTRIAEMYFESISLYVDDDGFEGDGIPDGYADELDVCGAN